MSAQSDSGDARILLMAWQSCSACSGTGVQGFGTDRWTCTGCGGLCGRDVPNIPSRAEIAASKESKRLDKLASIDQKHGPKVQAADLEVARLTKQLQRLQSRLSDRQRAIDEVSKQHERAIVKHDRAKQELLAKIERLQKTRSEIDKRAEKQTRKAQEKAQAVRRDMDGLQRSLDAAMKKRAERAAAHARDRAQYESRRK